MNPTTEAKVHELKPHNLGKSSDTPRTSPVCAQGCGADSSLDNPKLTKQQKWQHTKAGAMAYLLGILTTDEVEVP